MPMQRAVSIIKWLFPRGKYGCIPENYHSQVLHLLHNQSFLQSANWQIDYDQSSYLRAPIFVDSLFPLPPSLDRHPPRLLLATPNPRGNAQSHRSLPQPSWFSCAVILMDYPGSVFDSFDFDFDPYMIPGWKPNAKWEDREFLSGKNQ